MIRVKNHQTIPTIRPDIDLGVNSEPCCIKEATENQIEFIRLKSLSIVPFFLQKIKLRLQNQGPKYELLLVFDL